MRALASIRNIDKVSPIENADKICVYSIGGWNIVDQINKFKVNELVVMFEIDSWIPEHLAPFLANGGSVAKEYEGVMGFRLKTKKLRGVVSQGLILSLTDCGLSGVTLDQDVTDTLNVKKYEKPISNSGGPNAGQARGNFPSFIPKTDQERCVHESSIVSTDIGDMTIKELVDSNYHGTIKSFDHTTNEITYQDIIAIGKCQLKKKWLKITTSSGKSIVVTDDHLVYSETAKHYVQAKSIHVGDMLIST